MLRSKQATDIFIINVNNEKTPTDFIQITIQRPNINNNPSSQTKILKNKIKNARYLY